MLILDAIQNSLSAINRDNFYFEFEIKLVPKFKIRLNQQLIFGLTGNPDGPAGPARY